VRILRSLIAVPSGSVVLLLLTFAIDAVGLWLYPLPDGMEIGVTPMAEVIASRPLGALFFNGILRLPAAFLAAWLAACIAPTHGRWHGTAVGVLFAAFVVVSAFFAPFPLWGTLLAIVIFPLLAWYGGRLGERVPAPA
jgi:hypothetical protein